MPCKKIELSPCGKNRCMLFPTCVRCSFHFKIELSVDSFVFEDGKFSAGLIKKLSLVAKVEHQQRQTTLGLFFQKKKSKSVKWMTLHFFDDFTVFSFIEQILPFLPQTSGVAQFSLFFSPRSIFYPSKQTRLVGFVIPPFDVKFGNPALKLDLEGRLIAAFWSVNLKKMLFSYFGYVRPIWTWDN